jgi:hyperosmotically inducible periplasmic protein
MRPFEHMEVVQMTKLKIVSAITSLAFVAGMSACSTTKSAGTQLSDAGITSKVKAKFAADPDLNNIASIDVDTSDRVVRLSGTVDTVAERDEAEKLASNTEGVLDVDNDIEIRGGRSLGQGIDDSVITSKVKAKLAADGDMNPFNIDVDTRHGIVTLTGRVRDSDDKSAAERIARDTAGVQEVHNRLTVGSDAEANADVDDDHLDKDRY